MWTGVILATLVSVYDGDTFYVKIPNTHPLFGERLGIRLLGVDTPEIHGKTLCEKDLALKAKNFLEKQLPRQVPLANCKRDKYFRLDCDVMVGTTTLSSMLIKEGLGVPYKGGKKALWCR